MESNLLIDLLRLLAVIVIVLANAFFVAVEFALVNVRPTRISQLVAEGKRSALWVEKALENRDRLFATSQLGITLSSLGLGWLGEPALQGLLQPLLNLAPESIQPQLSHGLSAGLAFAIITFLHVVVGELTPRSIALKFSERTALLFAQPILWIERIFAPLVWVFSHAANALLRLLGVTPAVGHDVAHSVSELKMLVRASAESGLVEDVKENMVFAVFELGDTLVRQIMVPRTETVAVPADEDLESLIQVFVEHPYSKVPVYHESLDHVIGVLHVKDVLRQLYGPDRKEITARALMREPIFVPESARVDKLLELFRARRRHIAIVLDEYGGTAGVVTLEDLLEEIVGEVSDPFGDEPEIQPRPDGSSLIDGLTLIEDVNKHFGLTIEDRDYDTIAGYILGRLGRMAKVGDSIIADGIRLRVETMDKLRIASVSLTRPPGSQTTPEDLRDTELP